MRLKSFGRIAILAAFATFGAAEVSAQAGSTTATVRGRVTNAEGGPVSSAQIVVRHTRTGVRKGVLANSEGVYIVPFLAPGGPYSVSVSSVGFGSGSREFERFQLGEVLVVNFQLQVQAIAVEGLSVTVEASPLIETRQAGVIDRVSAIQIESLPTNGRNFSDFVALSPAVQTSVGDGSGGNLSLGGGRRGANNITVDGVNNNGTFFGGEARGSDRIAFAFSIETVKEFQVITNGYDVEFGNFTGGQINAVTKSGTNEYEGGAFFYRRDEGLTGDDFLGLAPESFSSNQLGVVLSGPIVRDKAHFLVSVDRQDRINPVRSLIGGPAVGDISNAALDDFISATQATYGFDASNEFGIFDQTNDETALFARVDWQLNDSHALTVRYNYTDLTNDNDRVSTNEGASNGGVFSDESNSFVLNVKSVITPSLFNDFRFQYATESRPRTAKSLLPQIEVFQVSSVGGFQDIEIFNDPVLPNSLDENVIQLINNIVWQAGDHTIKVGTNNQFYDIDNFFFFNGRGEFEFDGLDNYRLGIADEYSIATPGIDGTDPRAIYNVSEHAVYAQDEWAVNDRLTMTLGFRYDYTRFPDKPATNEGALTEFGLDTGDFPTDDNNIAPRFGFAVDIGGDGRSVLRGGAGLFYGRLPSVFWSNALLNTGESQGFVQCSGSFFESQAARDAVISILRGERETFSDCDQIPGGRGFGFTPNVNGFSENTQLPGSWKFNLGYDRELIDDLKVGIEITHSRTSDNFFNADVNLLEPQFAADGGRVVLSPIDEISQSRGEPGFGDMRKSRNFNDVLVMIPTAESRTWSGTIDLEKRFSNSWTGQIAYGLTSTHDNTSHSCCISSTAIFETPTAGNTNVLGEPGDELIGTWGPADFDRRHVLTVNAVYRDAFGLNGLQLSGFYRAQSGLPYTPLVDGDVNGDNRDGNDRAFIPDQNISFLFETPEDEATFNSLVNEHECLREQQGFIATRNSCRNPWTNRFDARISWKVPTLNGQDVEVIADIFNVLNMLNSDWGQVNRVRSNDAQLFDLEGFDRSTQQHIYSTNSSFGSPSPFGFTPLQWQLQLGVRYNIN